MNKAKMKIRNAPLAVRAQNALLNSGYSTIEGCMSLQEIELLAMPNLGKKTVEEIIQYLKQFKSNELDPQSERNNLTEGDSKERLEYLANILSLPLSHIALSVRAKNVIKELKLVFLKDLVPLSEMTILKRENCGIKTLKEIIKQLLKLELGLGMRLNPTLKMEINRKIGIAKSSESAVERFKKQYPKKVSIVQNKKSSMFSAKKIAFWTKCYELYNKGGTLKYVAKKVGLTRERVRQILVQGTKSNLFKYNPRDYKYVPKQQLINDIIRLRSLSKVAIDNKISTTYLKRLLLSYGINRKKIDKLMFVGQKRKIIDRYSKIADELGHYPTSTELQARPEWRAFEGKIRRTWKSIHDFRNELNIPSPPPFVEAVRPWLEHRMRLALIKRMQDLDIIREILTASGPLQAKQIAMQCKLNSMRAFKLTQLLIATGEVIKEGAGSSTRYNIINSGR